MAEAEPPGLEKDGQNDALFESIDVELDNNMEVLLLESLSGSTCGSAAAAAGFARPIRKTSEDSEEEAQFDLMQIFVTIYGLTGVICKTSRGATTSMMSKKNKKTNKRFHHTHTARTATHSASGSATFDSLDEYMPENAAACATSTNSGSTPASLACDYGLALDEPPTTAVVSFLRNAISSQQALETFLPSLPLRKQSRTSSRTLRYSASWSKGPQWNVLDQAANHPSTFPMVRVMKHENFKQGTRIGEISSYVHETIELCVFAGRSKELVPLGVTSIVVTGDEEVEQVLNLPVKQPRAGSSQFDKHFKTSKKRRAKKKAGSFSQNRRQRYELEDNATLRVGVRVLPQEAIRQAKQAANLHKEKEDKAMEHILESFMNDNLLAERLSDDDSLARRLAKNDREKRQQEAHHQLEMTRKACQTPQMVSTSWAGNFFCGAGAPLFPPSVAQPRAGQIPNNVVAPNEEKDDNPVVLPLSLVSSVSETITTVGSDNLREETKNF